MEEWKDIEGYEGLYQVSNYGRIKSLGNEATRKEKILKPNLSGAGYYQVGLCNNGIRKLFYVHRLVAEAFIPNPNNLKEINHKSEDKTLNTVENLEWCDRLYNMNYGDIKNKMSQSHIGIFINREDQSKKVYQYTLDGELIKVWESTAECEREGGFHQSSISNCCLGKQQKHKGYRWSYEPL